MKFLGSVKDIANGPPDVFLELAKELQIMNQTLNLTCI